MMATDGWLDRARRRAKRIAARRIAELWATDPLGSVMQCCCGSEFSADHVAASERRRLHIEWSTEHLACFIRRNDLARVLAEAERAANGE